MLTRGTGTLSLELQQITGIKRLDTGESQREKDRDIHGRRVREYPDACPECGGYFGAFVQNTMIGFTRLVVDEFGGSTSQV